MEEFKRAKKEGKLDEFRVLGNILTSSSNNKLDSVMEEDSGDCGNMFATALESVDFLAREQDRYSIAMEESSYEIPRPRAITINEILLALAAALSGVMSSFRLFSSVKKDLENRKIVKEREIRGEDSYGSTDRSEGEKRKGKETWFLIKPFAKIIGVLAFTAAELVPLWYLFLNYKRKYIFFSAREFLTFGPAPSLRFPLFVDDAADNVWDPAQDVCVQERFRDYSGVDSLTAFAASVFVFVVVQMIERYTTAGLFRFPGDVPYTKDSSCQEDEVASEKAIQSMDVEDDSTGNHVEEERRV
ncbi:hypothetical protein FGB62_53g014 [Gracilaria domingensis]|nr:hypothetical protein FGB62_53g014 [Gracilaria domingensis]